MTYEKLSTRSSGRYPEDGTYFSGPDHFWLRWRMRVLRNLIPHKELPIEQPLRVLEVGCGRGALRTQLEAYTQWTVDGADMNEAALRNAQPGRGRTLLYNILDNRPELRGTYDAVVLFDVLEHIEDPSVFLTAACRHLKPGGWLFINVPALPALYSRYDEAVGHFRRYDRHSMEELLKNQGQDLKLMELRFWGLVLVPVAWVRKLFLKNTPPEKIIATGFNPPARWINSVFRAAMLLETSVLNRPPAGTSLMVAARKRLSSGF